MTDHLNPNATSGQGDARITEELVTFAQVLAEDEKLRQWFLSLQPLPPNLRASAFQEMSAQMRANGEDAEFVSTISSLASAEIYEALRRALEELIGS